MTAVKSARRLPDGLSSPYADTASIAASLTNDLLYLSHALNIKVLTSSLSFDEPLDVDSQTSLITTLSSSRDFFLAPAVLSGAFLFVGR